MGTKAAKATLRSDVSLERESAAHTAALNSLAKYSAESNDLAKRKHAVEFWSMTHVRDTPQGKAYWERQLDARLAEDVGLVAIPPTSARDGGAAHAAPLVTGAASSTASSTSIAAVAAAEVAETAALAPAAVSAQSTLACAAATASGTIASSAWTPATLGAHPEHVNDSAKAVAARAATSAEPAARRRPGAHEACADVDTQRRRAASVADAAAMERVDAAEYLAHAEAQRFHPERRVALVRQQAAADAAKAATAKAAASHAATDAAEAAAANAAATQAAADAAEAAAATAAATRAAADDAKAPAATAAATQMSAAADGG
ncbi:hypothetical protein BU14_0147s0006 [Porphyra umbilicalis]|uniref:Uncharacterized protein n=1 Tax=Porphyra umbilicalis TaxID=2786 RepID=A0A1X6P9B1_PORUM|nr:hypothetical protein BU14_0147s0006 [Porphyra umbilicalis]|eukprot:OSX77481.1 hypothetical protein BU14_0147s0006 [Porphyra umbilicalis]